MAAVGPAVAIAARHCSARGALEVNSRRGSPLADGLTWPARCVAPKGARSFFCWETKKDLFAKKDLLSKWDGLLETKISPASFSFLARHSPG